MINLALSLVMATIGFGIWVNGVDFSDNAGKGDTPAGLLKDRRTEIDSLMAGLGPAEGTRRSARKELLESEDQRRLARVWYSAELEHLRTGATAAAPARTMIYANLLPAPDPDNRERIQMGPASDRNMQPLLSMAHYEEQSRRTQSEIADVMANYKKEAEKDIALTNELAGAPPAKKGLRQRQVEEKDKREGIVGEQRLVRPLFVNTAVESELILQRLKRLQEREKELVDYLRKKHKVEVALSTGRETR